jgi:alanyl-tRNA synthetase
VIHATLRRILGDHARQAGSLIEPGRLRFDFSHPSAVPHEVLEEAELEANAHLATDDLVRASRMSMDEAKAKGATALFDEKYGDVVRVIEIGDYSRELCGGTHVPRTGNVAVIRLLREGSIGAGMRRIEALVGPDALREINVERALLRDLVGALDAKDPGAAVERARRVVEENKRLRSELGRLRAGDREALIDGLATGADDVDGLAVVTAEVPDLDPSALRELALKVRDRLQDRPAVVVVGNAANGKAMLVAAVNAPAVERGVAAPALLRDAAALLGGGAGGKDQLANAGGTKADQVPAAIASIPVRVHALVAGG